jgi:hypothetical protein
MSLINSGIFFFFIPRKSTVKRIVTSRYCTGYIKVFSTFKNKHSYSVYTVHRITSPRFLVLLLLNVLTISTKHLCRYYPTVLSIIPKSYNFLSKIARYYFKNNLFSPTSLLALTHKKLYLVRMFFTRNFRRRRFISVSLHLSLCLYAYTVRPTKVVVNTTLANEPAADTTVLTTAEQIDLSMRNFLAIQKAHEASLKDSTKVQHAKALESKKSSFYGTFL